MMNTCPICGKRFPVIWPEHWIYKRNGVFYCSEQCLSVMIFRETNKLRQIDKERKRERYIVRRITLEQKKKAVQIAIEGGDPREYLKECGSKSPATMWIQIRQHLKKADPEMYEKLPARISPKTAGKNNTIQPPVVKLTGPIRIETPEANNVEIVETPEKMPKITVPVIYDGMTIREVEGLFGRYRYSDIGSAVYIDYENSEGVDVLSLTVEQWRRFRKEQEKAAMILGVEL